MSRKIMIKKSTAMISITRGMEYLTIEYNSGFMVSYSDEKAREIYSKLQEKLIKEYSVKSSIPGGRYIFIEYFSKK